MSWETLTQQKLEVKKSAIDETFASVFSHPNGKKLIEYLESITVNVTVGPTTASSSLWHLEGQRYLLNLIKLRIKKGSKNE